MEMQSCLQQTKIIGMTKRKAGDDIEVVDEEEEDESNGDVDNE